MKKNSVSNYLVVLSGAEPGKRYEIEDSCEQIVVGRAIDCDIVIFNKNISRKQFQLTRDMDGLWIKDLKSKNGTLVNGKKVVGSVALKDSDEISVADLRLGFVDSNISILKQLDSVHAFQPAPSPAPVSEREALSDKKPLVVQTALESSHWIDYVSIGLIGLVITGLLVGAILWLEG